jgi:hypothetical protein
MNLFSQKLGLLAVSLFCLLFFQSKANHLVGGDISYKCTASPGIFEVTLVVYRDCSGSALCTGTCGTACSLALDIKGADAVCNTTTFATVTLNLVSVRDADPAPKCATAKNTCNNMGCATAGTYSPGVERYEFVGFANIGQTSGIPANCCNVRLSFSAGTRNNNSTGSSGQNFYTEAVINRCLSVSPCNSSPELRNDPVISTCSNQPLIFNYGVFDSDDDSLTYAFAPALQGFNTPVTYNAPFTYQTPLPWTGPANGLYPQGISCNPQNGDIMFTPQSAGGFFTGIIAVEIKQWRKANGGTPALLGTTRKDVTMTIRNDCLPNNVPVITTNPPENNSFYAPKTNLTTCEGEQLCFTVTVKDTDYNTAQNISDTTYLSWDRALESYGATFKPTYDTALRKVNGPREDSYQFCWTPAIGVSRTAPYMFSVSTMDSKCPKPGQAKRSFSITVVKQADLFIRKADKKCGKWQISYVKGVASQVLDSTAIHVGKQPFDYQYSAGFYAYSNTTATPDILLKQPGQYLVKVIAKTGTCYRTFYDTLVIDTPIMVSTKDTMVCQGNPVTLSATTKKGVAPFTYKWFNSVNDINGTPLNSGNYAQSGFTFTATEQKRYTLQVTDQDGCVVYDSAKVSLFNGIQQVTANPPKCFGENNGSITIAVANATPLHKYKIDNNAFQSSPVFTGLSAGNYTISITDTSNCMNVQVLTLAQPALLRDTLSTSTAQLCPGSHNGSLKANIKGGVPPYRYSIDSTIFDTTPLFKNLATGTYKIHILDSNNCYVSISKTVDPADSIQYTVVTQNAKCPGASNGKISITTSGGKQPYQYKLDSGLYGSSPTLQNLAARNYFVTIKDANACTVGFNQAVGSPAVIRQTLITQHNTCYGGMAGSITIFTSGGTPPYQYKRSNGVYDTVSVFRSFAAGAYSFTIKDSNDCLLNFSQNITQPSQIGSTLSTLPISCNGKTDATIMITGTGGTPPFVYSIDSISFDSHGVFQQLPAAAYRVIVRDSFQCEKVFPVNITEPAKVSATLSSKPISCYNRNDGVITVTPITGRAPFSYSINGGAYGPSPVFSKLTPGTYLVRYRETGGCMDSLTASFINPIQIIAGNISGPSAADLKDIGVYSIPSQPGMDYTWFASKGTVISGNATPSINMRWDSTGVGKVSVRVHNDSICGDTATIQVTITSVGLDELSRSMGLTIYPNPARDILNITLQQLPEQHTLQLYDMQGRLLKQQGLKHEQQLNIETLSPGIYMLKIGTWSGQVIIE